MHLPLIFAAQNLVIPLENIKLCISLLGQSLWKLGIIKFYEKVSINSELFCESGQ